MYRGHVRHSKSQPSLRDAKWTSSSRPTPAVSPRSAVRAGVANSATKCEDVHPAGWYENPRPAPPTPTTPTFHHPAMLSPAQRPGSTPGYQPRSPLTPLTPTSPAPYIYSHLPRSPHPIHNTSMKTMMVKATASTAPQSNTLPSPQMSSFQAASTEQIQNGDHNHKYDLVPPSPGRFDDPYVRQPDRPQKSLESLLNLPPDATRLEEYACLLDSIWQYIEACVGQKHAENGHQAETPAASERKVLDIAENRADAAMRVQGESTPNGQISDHRQPKEHIASQLHIDHQRANDYWSSSRSGSGVEGGRVTASGSVNSGGTGKVISPRLRTRRSALRVEVLPVIPEMPGHGRV